MKDQDKLQQLQFQRESFRQVEEICAEAEKRTEGVHLTSVILFFIGIYLLFDLAAYFEPGINASVRWLVEHWRMLDAFLQGG